MGVLIVKKRKRMAESLRIERHQLMRHCFGVMRRQAAVSEPKLHPQKLSSIQHDHSDVSVIPSRENTSGRLVT